MWPANLALFKNVSTHYVETVKKLDFNRYVSCLGGLKVTHRNAVRDVLSSIPGASTAFYVCLYFVL